jgi:hypothetical protein
MYEAVEVVLSTCRNWIEVFVVTLQVDKDIRVLNECN